MGRKQGVERGSFSIRRIMVIVTLGPAVLVASAVGALSYLSGRAAVNDLVAQLFTEINGRIEDRVSAFLAAPPRLNEVNEGALVSGALSADDPASLERHLLTLLRASPSVSSIYFGNARGGIVDAGREGPGGNEYLIETPGFVAGQFRKLSIDSGGRRGRLLATIPDFDARARPWFLKALASGGPSWTDVFVLFTSQDLTLTAVRPVFRAGGGLVGVLAVDIFLSQLSDFLKGMDGARTAKSFILDRGGLLVASSVGASLYARTAGGDPRRIGGSENEDPVIAAASRAAATSRHEGPEPWSRLSFRIGAERYLALASPLREPSGLGWTIVSVFPEAGLMRRIARNNAQTILVLLLVGALALALCLLVARRITKGTRRLSRMARLIAEGRWQASGEGSARSRIKEVEELRSSLLTMKDRLQGTFDQLSSEIAERRRTELSLRESKRAYERLAKNIPVGVYLIRDSGNGEKHYEYMSPRFREIMGLGPGEEIHDLEARDDRIHPDDRESFITQSREAVETRRDFLWEGRILAQSEPRWIRRESKAETQEDGSTYWDGMVTDITEARLADEKIRSLLAEKELILREVHHRIKNNMSSVSSILSLQAEFQDDPRVATALVEARDRVQSMMILYDRLYRSDSFLSQRADEYLGEIADMIASQNSGRKGISLEKNLQPVELETKKLMPLGIIANELITNAYKYAFPGGRAGKLVLSLLGEGGHARLRVEDDGIGMAKDWPSGGFGHTIVAGLVQQIQGSLIVDTERGVRIEVLFPV